MLNHRAVLQFHRGIESHVAESPKLTDPSIGAVFYRPTSAGSATLIDVIDILDVIEAPTDAESRNARFICGD